MGGAASSSFPGTAVKKLKKSEEEMVRFMLPVYYLDEVVTREEIQAATATWELVLNDKAPEFLRRKAEEAEQFPYHCCVTFFYDSYYTRLFDIHPACRPLFKSGMKAQGRFLVKMISFSLSELDHPERFETALVKLTEVHYHRGVRAVEYSIVGEVLFWTLRFVLGKTVYTAAMHKLWVKIYCRMLKTIMPLAIAMEMQQIPFKNPANHPELRAGATFANEEATNLTSSLNTSEEHQNTPELKCEHLRTASSL